MLSVREIQHKDIDLICNYWLNSGDEYLLGMGVDRKKMPSRETFSTMLKEQLNLPIQSKNAYCIIWEYEGNPIGHSNTNPTRFGEEATMHLHLWNNETRGKGNGTQLLRMTLKLYFDNLKLKKLYCEPYALNAAPNKALEKAGFKFVKEYTTIPGFLNFEQPVKRWEMTREAFFDLQGKIPF
jgi:RimJ/RimL family protein N-acetyltransferase